MGQPELLSRKVVGCLSTLHALCYRMLKPLSKWCLKAEILIPIKRLPQPHYLPIMMMQSKMSLLKTSDI